MKNSLQFVCMEQTVEGGFFLSCFPPRALNEMWKCQNLLRNHVKDLLDLIKKPKVTQIKTQCDDDDDDDDDVCY